MVRQRETLGETRDGIAIRNLRPLVPYREFVFVVKAHA